MSQEPQISFDSKDSLCDFITKDASKRNSFLQKNIFGVCLSKECKISKVKVIRNASFGGSTVDLLVLHQVTLGTESYYIAHVIKLENGETEFESIATVVEQFRSLTAYICRDSRFRRLYNKDKIKIRLHTIGIGSSWNNGSNFEVVAALMDCCSMNLYTHQLSFDVCAGLQVTSHSRCENKRFNEENIKDAFKPWVTEYNKRKNAKKKALVEKDIEEAF